MKVMGAAIQPEFLAFPIPYSETDSSVPRDPPDG
jgi:hypothetical protein